MRKRTVWGSLVLGVMFWWGRMDGLDLLTHGWLGISPEALSWWEEVDPEFAGFLNVALQTVGYGDSLFGERDVARGEVRYPPLQARCRTVMDIVLCRTVDGIDYPLNEYALLTLKWYLWGLTLPDLFDAQDAIERALVRIDRLEGSATFLGSPFEIRDWVLSEVSRRMVFLEPPPNANFRKVREIFDYVRNETNLDPMNLYACGAGSAGAHDHRTGEIRLRREHLRTR